MEKIEGLKESLKNLLVEGDLPPAEALRAIAHFLLDEVEYVPEDKMRKTMEACKHIQNAIRILEYGS